MTSNAQLAAWYLCDVQWSTMLALLILTRMQAESLRAGMNLATYAGASR